MTNDHLRRRREATPSPSGSGLPMTRAELAEAVNQYVWKTRHEERHLDVDTLARYERGVSRWPNAVYRDGLRAVLGVETDADLGFFRTRRGRATHAPGRGAPATALYAQPVQINGSPTDFLAAIPTTATPVGVSWAEVEFVRETTRVIATSENRFGGGLASEMAAAQLRLVAGLLDAKATVNVRRAMAQAVGNLAGVVGFSAYDVAGYQMADRCYELALWCADEGASASLRASVLADMARKAAGLGHVREALQMIEAAQVGRGDLTATGRAMLAAWRARLLAQTGRLDDARDEIARADDWFAQRDPTADPVWLCYYDEAEHQGSIGKTRLPLARAGIDVEDTAARLTAAIEQHEAGYVRSRTFSRIRLATLLLTVGETNDAILAARTALDEASSVRSTRLRDELASLASASPQPTAPDIVDLRHDIATYVGTSR